MNIEKSWLRSFIIQTVGQLKVGKAKSQTSQNIGLDNLYPDGGYRDDFRLASPFGFIAGIPQGVATFYQGLFGSSFESITLAFIDANRPTPSGPGEAVLYSTDSSGQSIKVKITLGSDGTLTINAPVKVQVIAPEIDLGDAGLQKIINGEAFQTYFNTHQHVGNLGSPTGPPITPSDASHLSTTVKAKP